MPEAANPKLRVVVPPPKRIERSLPQRPYAELVVTSNFSFLRGASHPDELAYRAAELGYAAIAVTDRNTLAGVVRAHTAAKHVGMKLLIGVRLTLVDAPDVIVWATDRAAYAGLCRLLTTGKRRAGKGECVLSLTDLLEHAQGLLAAMVPPDPTHTDASYPLRLLKDGFGDRLSLIACCGYGVNDTRWLEKISALARAHAVPMLASNDAHYHCESRRMLQDLLTCVRHGCSLGDAGFRLHANAERFLKPPDAMYRLFEEYPQAIRRGLEIAERCTFSLDELKYEYPDELAPHARRPIEHLADLAWAGAAERYPAGVPTIVRDQLLHELRLIEELKIEPYFLTVHDLVRFARGRGILCQGRGSAANSAVCYCLGVTAVDPAKIDVLFERFVSAARAEPPDIDIDFEHERREEVIQYVYEKYGRDHAGMTATIISYRGRSAVRDVGKALGLGQDVVEQIAKRLDWWDQGVVSDEQLRGAKLDPNDRTVRLLVERTSEILGFPRHLSQHTGGMVMTRGPLCELVPIENAAMADRTVIEWDKDDIDDLGILKVDILALGMLTCISKGLAMLNAHPPEGSPKLELYTLPPEDPATYAMISDADTVGVFQIESRAQMSMLPRLRPKEFYDLVIEVAIVRPGPIQGDMVHPYLRRRLGLEPIVYPKPELQKVLGRTLGVPLFQEQAMKIVMVAAGFSGAEANAYRRAMAAWKSGGAVEEYEQRIVTGMLANGYTLDFAQRLCSQLRGFGSYGFPESHAASFALLVYASSWIKRYHPAVFACALLNSQPMGFYAPAQLVRDAVEHGVPVRPVDVTTATTIAPSKTMSPKILWLRRERTNPHGASAAPHYDWDCAE
jgi:error-prone DNA polymerase